jgi:hypothetical protein
MHPHQELHSILFDIGNFAVIASEMVGLVTAD